MEFNFDINDKEPLTEPNRQYYFIAKLSKWCKEQSEKLNRPLTFCTKTFGCQMNAKDSEKLAGILEKIGFVETDTEEADFVVYNRIKSKDKVL